MPLSDRRFDEKVEEFLAQHPFERYFDVGCGAGKYGKMIKRINSNAYVVGIEADSEYIEKYGTREIYDELINDRVEQYIRKNVALTTDIVIMGDLL
jgi:predicted TPR repeat methyltransferase